MDLVSVIIPTRNRAVLLREALTSVFAVDRVDFDLEVIVIDDDSSDDTVDVVAQFPVVYLRSRGGSASRSRTTGITAARGEFIAFLDDDDLWLPGNISPQLELLRAHPEYGAAYAQAQRTDSQRLPFGDPIPQGPGRSGWIFDELLTHWPQLGTVLVRTSVAREVGGFDENLISEEDWDWLLRIARRYPIGRIDQPVILFRQRGAVDDTLTWRRMPDTFRVFHRHTQHFSALKRLRLQRLAWRHKGWYAGEFLNSARHHSEHGDRQRMLLCLRYALRTSPLHALRGVTLVSPLRGPQH